MNALGLSMLVKMGCFCAREALNINGIKYVVKEHLAEGGFSTVDLIEHKPTKRKYALKRITCHSLDDQKIAMSEINYCKKFHHPNIIELVDSMFKGEADIVVNTTSEVFLVLPYYQRGTLHDHLALKSFNKNYLTPSEVLRLFHQICQALKYMHHYQPNPIAHRDLKTGNVCLDDQMNCILMDLGSCAEARVQICGAQDAQKLQDLAAERCSMTYRAPELFHVESYCVIDERTDIWSLGCVLYALCYFKSPYDVVYERGDSVNLAVISGTIHFPSFNDDASNETNGGPFPDDFHDLIVYMLNVNAKERPFIDDVVDKVEVIRNKVEVIA